MKKLERVISLFLITTFIFSNPSGVYPEPFDFGQGKLRRGALRDQEAREKKPEILSGLEEALRGDPHRLVQVARTAFGLSPTPITPATTPSITVAPHSPSAGPSTSLRAGLEEDRGMFHSDQVRPEVRRVISETVDLALVGQYHPALNRVKTLLEGMENLTPTEKYLLEFYKGQHLVNLAVAEQNLDLLSSGIALLESLRSSTLIDPEIHPEPLLDRVGFYSTISYALEMRGLMRRDRHDLETALSDLDRALYELDRTKQPLLPNQVNNKKQFETRRREIIRLLSTLPDTRQPPAGLEEELLTLRETGRRILNLDLSVVKWVQLPEPYSKRIPLSELVFNSGRRQEILENVAQTANVDGLYLIQEADVVRVEPPLADPTRPRWTWRIGRALERYAELVSSNHLRKAVGEFPSADQVQEALVARPVSAQQVLVALTQLKKEVDIKLASSILGGKLPLVHAFTPRSIQELLAQTIQEVPIAAGMEERGSMLYSDQVRPGISHGISETEDRAVQGQYQIALDQVRALSQRMGTLTSTEEYFLKFSESQYLINIAINERNLDLLTQGTTLLESLRRSAVIDPEKYPEALLDRVGFYGQISFALQMRGQIHSNRQDLETALSDLDRALYELKRASQPLSDYQAHNRKQLEENRKQIVSLLATLPDVRRPTAGLEEDIRASWKEYVDALVSAMIADKERIETETQTTPSSIHVKKAAIARDKKAQERFDQARKALVQLLIAQHRDAGAAINAFYELWDKDPLRLGGLSSTPIVSPSVWSSLRTAEGNRMIKATNENLATGLEEGIQRVLIYRAPLDRSQEQLKQIAEAWKEGIDTHAVYHISEAEAHFFGNYSEPGGPYPKPPPFNAVVVGANVIAAMEFIQFANRYEERIPIAIFAPWVDEHRQELQHLKEQGQLEMFIQQPADESQVAEVFKEVLAQLDAIVRSRAATGLEEQGQTVDEALKSIGRLARVEPDLTKVRLTSGPSAKIAPVERDLPPFRERPTADWNNYRGDVYRTSTFSSAPVKKVTVRAAEPYILVEPAALEEGDKKLTFPEVVDRLRERNPWSVALYERTPDGKEDFYGELVEGEHPYHSILTRFGTLVSTRWAWARGEETLYDFTILDSPDTHVVSPYRKIPQGRVHVKLVAHLTAAGLEEYWKPLVDDIEEAIPTRKRFPVFIETVLENGKGAVVLYRKGGRAIQSFLPMAETLSGFHYQMSLDAKLAWLEAQGEKPLMAFPLSVDWAHRPTPRPIFALRMSITPEVFKEQAVFEAEIGSRRKFYQIDHFLSWLLRGGIDPRGRLIQYEQDASQWRFLRQGQRLEIIRWLSEQTEGTPLNESLFALFDRIVRATEELPRTRIYAVTGMARLATTPEQRGEVNRLTEFLLGDLSTRDPDRAEFNLQLLARINEDFNRKISTGLEEQGQTVDEALGTMGQLARSNPDLTEVKLTFGPSAKIDPVVKDLPPFYQRAKADWTDYRGDVYRTSTYSKAPEKKVTVRAAKPYIIVEPTAGLEEPVWPGSIDPQQALTLTKLMITVINRIEQVGNKPITFNHFESLLRQSLKMLEKVPSERLKRRGVTIDQATYFFGQLPRIIGASKEMESSLLARAILFTTLAFLINERWHAGSFPFQASREDQVSIFLVDVSLQSRRDTRATTSFVDAAISQQEQREIASRLLDVLLAPPPTAGLEEKDTFYQALRKIPIGAVYSSTAILELSRRYSPPYRNGYRSDDQIIGALKQAGWGQDTGDPREPLSKYSSWKKWNAGLEEGKQVIFDLTDVRFRYRLYQNGILDISDEVLAETRQYHIPNPEKVVNIVRDGQTGRLMVVYQIGQEVQTWGFDSAGRMELINPISVFPLRTYQSDQSTQSGLEEGSEEQPGAGDQVEERRHLAQELHQAANESEEKLPRGPIRARDLPRTVPPARYREGPIQFHVTGSLDYRDHFFQQIKALIAQHPEWGVESPGSLAQALGVSLDYLLYEMSEGLIIEQASQWAASNRPAITAPIRVSPATGPTTVVEVTTVGPERVEDITSQAQRQAAERVMAIFQKITPSTTTMVGIGPTQAKIHEDTLRVIAPLMPAALRQQIFVVASDATQGDRLTKRGLIASSEPIVVVRKLAEHFGPVRARFYYHASDLELGALSDAIILWGTKDQFTLERRNTTTELRTFLQELLANLMGIGLDQVDPTTVDQLTSAVDLLVKA